NKIYVNVNACRHRGTVVCNEESGNTRFFVCPYHGWSYKRDGTLNNITDRDNFPAGWGEDIKGLVPASKIFIYRG
ncbi:MAG: Rieske 2Fe-2S domain-containing protein, partial [Gammaproteobacteria bacterium]|nr:Rieske 2Fe-2S domain-containing protein [Gammaproteobacteria bacterium]NIO61313.1 Rieske 2Fe-2S domain-containing protein [Gammaproteobacteria bacterium]